MPFECRIPVRFADCDVARIVYYPRFLHFCHVTMEELFAHEVGVPYHRVILEENVGYPTVELSAEFAEPVPMGEVLRITAAVLEVTERSVRFRYEGRRESDGTRAFVVRSKTVAVDMEDWRSVPIPAHHRRVFERIRDAEPPGAS